MPVKGCKQKVEDLDIDLFNPNGIFINISMLTATQYVVPTEYITEAENSLPSVDFKLTLNQPTGRFFYDKWVIKNEFKDTIWDRLLKLLPENIGEARLIKLDPGTAYRTHSDIDDRYHLNITGDCCYLINLDTETMYKTTDRSVWYNMNAGPRHTAANFNRTHRIQFVVRKLLVENDIVDGIKIVLKPKGPEQYYRFIFDDILSPWLNRNVKDGYVGDFNNDGMDMYMTLDPDVFEEFKLLSNEHFNIELL